MASSATHYWLSGSLHRIGDIVMPGRWGRTVLNTPGHRWLKMELQFEQVRRSVDEQLPSRLESSFLFLDAPTASLLRTKRGDRYLYKVSLLDLTRPSHVADMALVHPELELHDAQWGNPRLYWTVRPVTNLHWPEVVTTSPFVIHELMVGAQEEW